MTFDCQARASVRARRVAAVLTAIVSLVACAHTDRGTERDALGRVLPVPTSPPTQPPKLFVRADKSYDAEIRNVVTDLQRFWTTEFPNVYQGPYKPVRRFFAYASATRMPVCDRRTAPYLLLQNNAFYCREDDFIAWDDGQLFPGLDKDFGRFAIALVLAHEWGHAIQQRAEVDQDTVIMEQQADCFAGAWTRHVETDPASRSRLGFKAADLDVALAGLVRFRDLIGMTAASLGAHGTGFDRVRAFQEGYAKGAGECARYAEDPPVLVGIPFTSLQSRLFGGDAPFSKVVPRVTKSLNEYWRLDPGFTVEKNSKRDPKRVAACSGPILTVDGVSASDLSFCGATRTVRYSETKLRRMYDDFGDFSIATAFGELWAKAQVPTVDGTAPSPERVLCHTGAWAHSVFQDTVSTEPGGPSNDSTLRPPTTLAPSNRLTLSPGDLDESVQWLLRSDRPTSGAAGTPGRAFALVDAFRVGFTGQHELCDRL